MTEMSVFRNDCLDDVTPTKGFPWRRFNEVTRQVRARAEAAGRPTPGRQHVMDAMLRVFEAHTAVAGALERLAEEAILAREADDQRRRGTRTRALEAKHRMGWR